MSLNKRGKIARRFLRSIRIDSDLGQTSALQGFVCPQSSADVLMTLARHVSETGQGAFTWTGPYGSGKSSLVVAFSALLNGNSSLQKEAARIFGKTLAKTMWNALPPGTKGWRIVPVVGRRDKPVAVIGDGIKDAGLVSRSPRGGWNERNLIASLTEAATIRPKAHGGVILFIDELGKLLEAAAQDGADIYVFQELAEAAARSNGRLLVIGVLHQAFEEYAHRLSRETRDEWAKIQGRFVDLVVDTAGEEQVDLIGRAIESDHQPREPGKLARLVAKHARRDRGAEDTARFASMIERCWPLHPVVACLLGPISRRRFGQNQRSIFGFLNSAEPHGLQDFLNHAGDGELYGPDRLWDYLRTNLEPSILASPDGHRWALAAEALERCEAIGGGALHTRLLKAIGVIDLFKERSGLVASFDLLCACFADTPSKPIKDALAKLDEWSFTIFKKFQGAHAIFAGSDFDIEKAVRAALEEIDAVDFKLLKGLAGLQPVLAKRHYHDTGAMRWFTVDMVPVNEVVNAATEFKPENGAIGQFLLAIPTANETEEDAEVLCRKAARCSEAWDTVVGMSNRSRAVVPLARELFALEGVSNHPELAGDSVARREVHARLAVLQSLVETELHKAFDAARWFQKNHQPKPRRQADLNAIVSDLADNRFGECPRLHNELLNRQKPSSNAIAAQNLLLRNMVLKECEPRLGIDGFPAEGGLFASLLESTGLYRRTRDGWRFVAPVLGESDPSRLFPIWDAAFALLRKNRDRTIAVSELFELWRRPPFGVKDGLMPVLAVAFILSQRDKLAVYREGIFRAKFDDVDVDYLAKDPAYIQLRWMDLTDVSRSVLSGMAEIVRDLDRTNTLAHLEPIDVARGLVAIFDRLPEWTKRTMRLSTNAVRVRDLFKRAKDPNKFLFDDIPGTLGEDMSRASATSLTRVVTSVRDGLEELVNAYPSMLRRLRDIMLSELQVPNAAPQSLAELRYRAENVRELSGDFKLEAFVGRLALFDGQDETFEGIASLAANKPPRDWVDPDLDQSAIELADLAQKFLRAETYARVKGRADKRQALAVVIGMNGKPGPLLGEFDVADADRAAINGLIERVTTALEEVGVNRRNVILAALAELSARYIQAPDLGALEKHGKKAANGGRKLRAGEGVLRTELRAGSQPK
jgi:hypothetical protein